MEYTGKCKKKLISLNYQIVLFTFGLNQVLLLKTDFEYLLDNLAGQLQVLNRITWLRVEAAVN
jgi:hypothetical protein